MLLSLSPVCLWAWIGGRSNQQIQVLRSRPKGDKKLSVLINRLHSQTFPYEPPMAAIYSCPAACPSGLETMHHWTRSLPAQDLAPHSSRSSPLCHVVFGIVQLGSPPPQVLPGPFIRTQCMGNITRRMLIIMAKTAGDKKGGGPVTGTAMSSSPACVTPAASP